MKTMEMAWACLKNAFFGTCKNGPDLGSGGKKKKERAAKNYMKNDDIEGAEKVAEIEWEKAVRLAQDREGWRYLVEALCATRQLEAK